MTRFDFDIIIPLFLAVIPCTCTWDPSGQEDGPYWV